eukprot:12908995-Prorocentrum_lima.AAC.1
MKEEFGDDEDEISGCDGEMTREASTEKARDSEELTMLSTVHSFHTMNIDNHAAKDNTMTTTTES